MFKPVDHVVCLDIFYDRIIKELAKKQDSSVSETLNHLIINWVNHNRNLLEKEYKISFRETMDKINREKITWKRMMEKNIKKLEEKERLRNIIQKLIEFSEIIESMQIEILATNLGTSIELLKEIILKHRNEFKKFGFNYKIKGDLIIKE